MDYADPRKNDEWHEEGALVAAGAIPISEAALRTAIETETKKAFVAANLECFERGMRAAGNADSY